MSFRLLTRDGFREGVFARDNHVCVVCGEPAVDAHHIIERRLWDDGGYYLENGASLCAKHHLEAEMTTLSVREIRDYCGISNTTPCLPDHMYDDQEYDKWGNIILDATRRVKGELFNDESVQKILKQGGVLEQFVDYVKYPRTFHLPWSPGIHSDDRMMKDTSNFVGRKVIVMEKMDGENTTLYRDHVHARAIDSGNHPSRTWIKWLHGVIGSEIPEGWRINVENLYAKHSIKYTDLDSYAYGFAIWDETNRILTWDDTLQWFELLGITPCPVIYHGIYNEQEIKDRYEDYKKGHECEGYVIRVDEPFRFSEFRKMVGKYVRKGHIQTTKHWMYGQQVIPNDLKYGVSPYPKTA